MESALRLRAGCVALVVLAVPGPASAQSDESSPPTVTDVREGTHEESPADVYLPSQRQQRETSIPARPLRNGLLSVQVNVDENGQNILGDAANEPSIAVDSNEPSLAAIGWRQFDNVQSNFRQAGWAYTQDGGASWTFPGVIEPGVFRSDPVLDADANGNFYYNSLSVDQQGTFFCDVFISEDGGQSWGPGIFAWGGDKQWMVIDRTDGIGRGNIYANWTVNFSSCPDEQFTRSYDQGESYLSCIEVPAQPFWGTLAVGPDGAVYVASATGSVSRSTTLQNPELPPAFDLVSFADLGGFGGMGGGPNPGGLLGQTWIATDHSTGATAGNVYVLSSVYRGASDPLDVLFTRSEDGGETWSTAVKVNDDPARPDAWQWFGTMSVAPNGRIDVIWNDTRNSRQVNISEMFYASSIDGGRTWSKNVAVTPPFDSWVGWPNQDKIGDYYDMVSDDDGVNIAYAATFNGEQDVWFLRIGDAFCPADIDDNDAVDMSDLLAVLVAWGPCQDCDEDIDGDGFVGVSELLAILAAWGPCTTGACCLPDASCFVDSSEACAAAGGSYQGNGSDCETTCRGACCLADGTCIENTVENECLAGDGIFGGNGGTCERDCRTGACCFADSCIVVIEPFCTALGGMARGEGSTCESRCDFSADDCADAVIVANGSYYFSTIGSSEAGPALPPACDEGAGLNFVRDVWFRYQAPIDGTATASVCASNFNNRMAIYDDGDCPGAFVACSDDACGVVNTRAVITFPVSAGAVYLIRIGSRTTGGVGTGTLEITSVP